jgi:hypothetical protein
VRWCGAITSFPTYNMCMQQSDKTGKEAALLSDMSNTTESLSELLHEVTNLVTHACIILYFTRQYTE